MKEDSWYASLYLVANDRLAYNYCELFWGYLKSIVVGIFVLLTGALLLYILIAYVYSFYLLFRGELLDFKSKGFRSTCLSSFILVNFILLILLIGHLLTPLIDKIKSKISNLCKPINWK